VDVMSGGRQNGYVLRDKATGNPIKGRFKNEGGYLVPMKVGA
jgi:hypothetical protein